MQKEEIVEGFDKISVDDKTTILVLTEPEMTKLIEKFIIESPMIIEKMLKNPQKYEHVLSEPKSEHPFKLFKRNITITHEHAKLDLNLMYNYILKRSSYCDMYDFIKKIKDDYVREYLRFNNFSSSERIRYYDEIKPDNKHIKLLVAGDYRSCGKYTTAIKILNEIKDDEELASYINEKYAYCFEQLKNYPEAIKYYQLIKRNDKILDIIFKNKLTEHDDLLLEILLQEYEIKSDKEYADKISKLYMKKGKETEAVKWLKLAL